MTANSGGFQFSLVGMLLAMAVVAAAMAVLFVFPDALATPIIIFLFIAVPALLTTHIVYGSGYERTFCIGALFPTGFALFASAFFFGFAAIDGPPISLYDVGEWMEFFETSSLQFRLYAGNVWSFAVIIGLLCVLSRWAMERRATRP